MIAVEIFTVEWSRDNTIQCHSSTNSIVVQFCSYCRAITTVQISYTDIE